MEPSKATDKLMVLKPLLQDMPLDRVKVINITWDEVEGQVVPSLHAEFYEEQYETEPGNKQEEE